MHHLSNDFQILNQKAKIGLSSFCRGVFGNRLLGEGESLEFQIFDSNLMIDLK